MKRLAKRVREKEPQNGQQRSCLDRSVNVDFFLKCSMKLADFQAQASKLS